MYTIIYDLLSYERYIVIITCVFYPLVCSLDAGAVIHTHSKAAAMVTLLYPGKEFKISHMEMIKGIKRGTSGDNMK